MNVSLRSQMTAGVAALGAAVVAVAPITQPDLLPSAERVAAAIQLSAFSNPVIAISDSAFFAVQDFLDQSFLSDDIVWPDSFYGEEFFYAPLNIGLIPDLVNQLSTGPLSGLVNNLSGYGFAGAYGAFALFDGVAGSAFNAPFAVVAAVQELIAGNQEAALQELVTGIVEPLQFAVEAALFAVGYIVDNVIDNLQTVTAFTIPFLVAGLVDAVVANVSLIAGSLVDTAASFVGNLADLDIEGAWNAVVDGILGPDGTLGQIANLTTGVGLGEEIDGEFIMTNPSIRSVLTSELQRLGGQKFLLDGGITNDPLFVLEAEAAAAVTEPAPVAALQVSAPAPVEAAPEAVVEAPAPVSEPAATTEVADVAPAAVQESSEASATPSASTVKSRVSDDSAVSTGTSIVSDSSTGAGAASDTGATAPDAATDTAPDTAGPTGATASDSGSLNESSAPKKSSPRVSRKAAAAAGNAG